MKQLSVIKLDKYVTSYIVYQVLAHRPESDISGALAAMNKFIASDIDPVIEANEGVPVSSPRDVAKKKIQTALLKSIYQLNEPNFSCVGSKTHTALAVSFIELIYVLLTTNDVKVV